MQIQLSDFDPRVGEIDDGLSNVPDYETVQKNALRFNMRDIDAVFPAGVPLDGSAIIVQGEEKNRKTTVAQNWVRWWCNSSRMRGYIAVDVLEARSSPAKWKRDLVCMEATGLAIGHIYTSLMGLPMTDGPIDRETGKTLQYTDMSHLRDLSDPRGGPDSRLFRISPKRMMGGLRTPLQHRFIEEAKEKIADWPLMIFGSADGQGGTKNIEMPGNGRTIEECVPYSRWMKYKEELDVSILIVDHAHEYNVPSGFQTLEGIGLHIAAAVSILGMCLIILSQTSLGTDRMYARGGTKLAEMANVVIMPRYDNSDDLDKNDLEKKYSLRMDCLQSEDEPFPNLRVPIEPFSGLILPYTYPILRGGRW